MNRKMLSGSINTDTLTRVPDRRALVRNIATGEEYPATWTRQADGRMVDLPALRRDDGVWLDPKTHVNVEGKTLAPLITNLL